MNDVFFLRRFQIFKLIVILTFSQIVILKIFGKTGMSFFNYADELLLIGLLIFLLNKVSILITNKYFKLFIILYTLLLLWGLLSNISSSSFFLPALLQILLDFKFFVFMLSLLILCKGINIYPWVIKFSKIIIICNIPLIVVQFFFPSVNNLLFDSSGGDGRIFIFGQLIERALGVFWHSSQLAVFCAFMIFLFWQSNQSKKWLLLLFIQFFLTFQRQEIATVFALLLFCYFFTIKNNKTIYSKVVKLFLPILFLVITYVFFIFFQESFSLYQESDSFLKTEDVRLIFHIDSFKIAWANWPFGSGFGTYGGHAAFMFNSALYKSLHYDRYYWYEEGRYMTDTYYPHIVAEVGFIGFVLYLSIVITFFNFFTKGLVNGKMKLSYYFSFLFLFLVAITSPVINDPFTIVLASIIPMCFQKNIYVFKTV